MNLDIFGPNTQPSTLMNGTCDGLRWVGLRSRWRILHPGSSLTWIPRCRGGLENHTFPKARFCSSEILMTSFPASSCLPSVPSLFLAIILVRTLIQAYGRSLDHQSRPEQLREYNDPSWDVLQVLPVIPQKSRTFSKTFTFRGLYNSVPPFFDRPQILY
jgi:hypothetical protein